MYIANDLKREFLLPKGDEYRAGFGNIVFEILERFIEDKPMFTMDNFTLMYCDEFSMKTSCHKDIFSTMYLEINQPNNYKPKKISLTDKKKDKIEIPELYFSLEDFKKSFFETAVQYLDGNNLIWVEKNSICIKATVYDEDIGIQPYYLRIIPCLTFFNKENERGVMYYAGRDIEIEYPLQAVANYESKNTLTGDVYRQTCLIFKNILLKEKNIDRLPSEIIETVLYNVPTEMYLDDKHTTMLSIVNYLRNKNVKEFVTLDEQDYAFTSLYRSMSLFYVKHILKIIEKYLERAR
ncbi:MAG: hypothetical protein E7354_01605 [Clostridiales bacterium]|nr:hypothetical protein [Clostridiales bacterium]